MGYLIVALLIVGCRQINSAEVEVEGTEPAPDVEEEGMSVTPTAQPVASLTPTPVANGALPTASAEPTVAVTSSATSPPPSPTDDDPQATSTPTVSPSPPPAVASPPDGTIIVDHTSVADFEQIPDEYIQAAAGLNMLFIDRSVGNNIDRGLTCLSYPTDEEAPHGCTRHEHSLPEFSVDPSELNWSRPGGYNRENWDYRDWEGNCDLWYDKVSCFIEMVGSVVDQYDVVSFQFSYLAVGEGSTIADQPGGYFWDNPDLADVYDQEAFEDEHPDTTFIYWTTSLARSIGTPASETFNEQMRQYAIDNGKVLFDVADILSHDPDGNPCYDNRDGVPYEAPGQSENYPDDGVQIPAICQHYTTEANGGHLGRVSTGRNRVAQAFWVLMARIAGWDGN